MTHHYHEFGANRFGISEEELEFDENDPSWIDLRMSPGSNVFTGPYQSAKGFIERAQRQQRAYLEKKVAEREALRQLIHEKVSREFDEKLALHMAKFQPKKQDSPVSESHPTSLKQESNEGCKESRHFREPQAVYYPLSAADNVNSYLPEAAEPMKSMEMFSTTPEPMQPSKAATTMFTVPESLPATSVITASTPTPSPLSFPLSTTSTTFIDASEPITVIPSTLPTTPVELSPISSFLTSKLPLYCECELCSSDIQSSPKPSSPVTDTPNIMADVPKTGHATLTRTDSIPSFPSLASRTNKAGATTTNVTMKRSVLHAISNVRDTNEVNTTHAVATDDPSFVPFFESDDQPQSNSEEQLTSVKDSVEKTLCSSAPFEQSVSASCTIGTLPHPIYEQEIAFAKDFIAKTAVIPASIKNELKRAIKEKISISTKKLATPNDIAQIVRFFNNLLSGVTIYGFNDKMINLKDDELARNWAMVHIIDTYLDLVPQDLSLLYVIAEVLSSLDSSSITFSKLLHGKFFITSPLLALNHSECMQRILDLKKRSERYAEALSAWCSREIATIRLFLALKMLNANEKHRTMQTPSGLGLLWKLIVVSINDKHAAFGAVLIAQILKEYWKPLHASYGKQMEKLIAIIDRSYLPFWKLPPQKIMPENTEANETLQAVIEKYLTTLKFAVDDCLASLRS